MSGVAKDLRVNLATAPGSGKNWDVVFRVNNTPTDLGCMVADTNTSCDDLESEVYFSEGDKVGVVFTAAGSPTGTGAGGYTLELEVN